MVVFWDFIRRPSSHTNSVHTSVLPDSAVYTALTAVHWIHALWLESNGNIDALEYWAIGSFARIAALLCCGAQRSIARLRVCLLSCELMEKGSFVLKLNAWRWNLFLSKCIAPVQWAEIVCYQFISTCVGNLPLARPQHLIHIRTLSRAWLLARSLARSLLL